MGRVKSLSNSGSFVLRKDNQNAKGEYQVYIHWIERLQKIKRMCG